MMIVVALLCVWLGVICNRANRQKRAVEAIVRAGGQVQYDYQTIEKNLAWRNDATPPGPDWLRKLIGIDYVAAVVVVSIRDDHPISKEFLAALEELPQLKGVGFQQVDLTISTLDRLSGLTQLNSFRAWACSSVTDAGWKPLAHFTHLKMLALSGLNVNDATLSNITGLADLTNLQLWETEITDGGLRHLDGLSRLEHLDLSWNYQLTDAGLQYFKSLSRLKQLDIRGTSVTHVGVKELKEALPSLQVDGP